MQFKLLPLGRATEFQVQIIAQDFPGQASFGHQWHHHPLVSPPSNGQCNCHQAVPWSHPIWMKHEIAKKSYHRLVLSQKRKAWYPYCPSNKARFTKTGWWNSWWKNADQNPFHVICHLTLRLCQPPKVRWVMTRRLWNRSCHPVVAQLKPPN